MAIRALSALATAVILSTASSSWAQDAPGAGDDAAGADATLGDDGATEQDAAPDDGDDAGADDSGVSNGVTVDSGGAPGLPGAPGIPSTPSLPSYPPGVPTAPTSPPDPGGAANVSDVPQGTPNDPTIVDAGSSAEAGPEVSPSWGDAAPAAEQVQGLFPPDDGCGGCSTGDSSKSGPLVFILAALVGAWRCRKHSRGAKDRVA